MPYPQNRNIKNISEQREGGIFVSRALCTLKAISKS